jgi:predicted polyphosphate/ATP-dependent NAD kinase
MKIGLIVNPIAGMGGKVGLRGSDGPEIVAKAQALGAVPESNAKTVLALQALAQNTKQAEIYTCAGEMGERACKKAGLKYKVVAGKQAQDKGNMSAAKTATGLADRAVLTTTPADTTAAAKALCRAGVELLLFAGGDGTARNILDAVGEKVTVLGIPAGCKIHSGVYALNPRDAGELAAKVAGGRVAATKEAEVMDIDEDLFRENIVQARLYGYLRIPDDAQLTQCSKSAGNAGEAEEVDAIAEYVAESMAPDVLYIVGTGSTTAAVMKELHLPCTLLGVDLVYNKKLVAADCTEQQILAALAKYPKVKLLVTVIGGQGYVFGRGNQQLSAAVLQKIGKDNIMIIAAKSKVMALPHRRLYVDTGDAGVNKMLSGYVRIIVGYKYELVMPIGD